MGPAVSSAVALLARSEREAVGSAAYDDLVSQALDHLREAYRTSWSLPGTREALANGSHIMLRGGMDFGSLLLGRKGDSEDGGGGVKLGGQSKRTLRTLVQQVYREYQRQLWDPEGVADGASLGCSDSDGNGEWHFQSWGPVGVFCMDVKETKLWKGRTGEKDSDSALISEAQWRCFSEAMNSEEIQTLIVCCELPFVDDSIGDARYARCERSERREYTTLLKTAAAGGGASEASVNITRWSAPAKRAQRSVVLRQKRASGRAVGGREREDGKVERASGVRAKRA
jgi:hypothetical protein